MTRLLGIRGRLIIGFSTLCLLLAVITGVTIVKLASMRAATDRTTNHIVPTASTASNLVTEVYASLASLRGWLITGSDAFKVERRLVWSDIERRGSELDRLSTGWASEQNRQDWLQAKAGLQALHTAQDKAEAVAHTSEDQPATRMLATEAAPLSALILQKVTSMIDEEGSIVSDDPRKSLLLDFADLRGSMAMAVGAIRAYLLTAEPGFRAEFEKLWAVNQAKFDKLLQRRAEMTIGQQAAFDALAEARASFSLLPQKMFDIRASDRWNTAQWVLANEASPRANALLDILSGSRAASGERVGGMVFRQLRSLDSDGNEMLEQGDALSKLLWVLLGVGISLACAIVYLTSRSIVPPLRAMTAAMGRLAGGDVATTVPDTSRGDEIGRMAQAVQVFKDNAIEKQRLEEQHAVGQAATKLRQEKIDQLIDCFGRDVGGVLKSLAETSAEMSRTSTSLEGAATATGGQADRMLSEVEHTSAMIQAVAAAAQQLSASIGEIGGQVSESARGSTEVTQQADNVVTKVEEMRVAADQIGAVVQLINDIAGQTNLLALNATIEAARAGDAGKGFAVVAGEVKALATQTAQATQDIARQVASIQATTKGAASAIQGISGAIRGVNETAVAIAAAVKQQAAATEEIARSIEQVSGSAATMTQSMHQVQAAVGQASGSAGDVRRTSAALSDDTERLSTEVSEFLGGLKDLEGGVPAARA